jgi:hypothetical protein
MKIRTVVLVLLVLLVTGACASTGERTRYRSDELTREEIISAEAGNLFEVVNRLRPRWVTAERRAGDRSFGLTTGVVVFQEQTYLGDLSVLRQWNPSAVYSLEWMDGATAAASLPGLGASHVAGAIIIHTSPEG